MRILVLTYRSPFTSRGYIRLVNIRPDQRAFQFWFCDECGERVTKAKHVGHARYHT